MSTQTVTNETKMLALTATTMLVLYVENYSFFTAKKILYGLSFAIMTLAVVRGSSMGTAALRTLN